MKDKLKIPKGLYCYDENGVCPYWKKIGQYNGYCKYLKMSDKEIEYIECATSLLWDQCKECGINTEG